MEEKLEEVHTPKRVAAQPGRRRKIALIAAACARQLLLAAYLGLSAGWAARQYI